MSRRVRSRGESPVTPTLVDRVVSYFDPVRGMQRHRARMVLALTGGGYLGGRRDRRATQEWRTSSGSADADLLPDLAKLRERTRDLERNAPMGTGAINTGVTNIVGTGLIPQSMIDRDLLGLDDATADAWQKQAEREWWLWAASPECDLTRTQDFCGLQDLALRSVFGSGDVFAIRQYRERAGNPYGLKLQLIEADRVSNPRNLRDLAKLENGNSIAGGVEFDSDGAPIAYHVMTTHPGDMKLGVVKREWQRIPAFGDEGDRVVLHLFKRRRPNQSRGIPFLAPVIEQLKQLDRYSEAELMAAVISSFFTVFVKTPGATGMSPVEPTAETGARVSDKDFKLASGMILDLDVGEDIETADPSRPNSNFEPYFLAVARQIGSALEIPSELVLKVFNSSYSASRAALLEAWKFFRGWRDWMAWSFCQPCYEWVIVEAVARGRLAAPGFFADPLIRQAWLGSQWTGPPQGQIDPESEANAAQKWVALGIKTRQAITAEITGGDYETTHAQLAKERRMRLEAGLEEEKPAESTQEPAEPERQSPARETPPARNDRQAASVREKIATRLLGS